MTGMDDSYRLAPIQRGMLFHHLLAPRSGVDIVQLVCTFSESIDESAFETAWQQIVQRHPVLRTGFRWQDVDVPVQEIHDRVELSIERQDWSDLSVAQRRDRLEDFLAENRRRGFDLTRPPLMRLALIRIGSASSHFVWTFHHILMEGRSVPIVFHDVAAQYEAIQRGEESRHPTPPSYRKYVDWVYERDDTDDKSYWRRVLGGFARTTPFHVDRALPRRLDDSADHALETLELSTELTANLRAFAQASGLSVGTLVCGAWAVLLSRYSGETDVVFGAAKTLRGTSLSGAEKMVGLMLNTVPIRANVDPDKSIVSWLTELHQAQWREMRGRYGHTPLVEIERCSDLPRGEALFETIVVYENYRIDRKLREQGDLWKNAEFQFFVQTNYPLTLCAYLGSALLVEMTFDRRRFDTTTITAMLTHLETLLAGMASNPDGRLADLPLLTPEERHQQLTLWNQTDADYPRDRCVHELFEDQVARDANAVAVRMGHDALTFGELNGRANQLAHYLQRRGVRPEQPVGILLDRSLDMYIALIGILKAGGAYVPLDPAYPAERLAYLIKDSGASSVVTRDALAADLSSAGVSLVCLDRDADAISRESRDNTSSGASAAGALYVIYTSGSTGKPKGVVGLHRGAVNRMHWMWEAYPFTAEETCSQRASLSFVDSVWEIFGPLCRGVCNVIVPDEMARDPRRLVDTLSAQGVTRVTLVPSLLDAMLSCGSDLSSRLATLKLCVVSGEPLSSDSAGRLLACLPGCRVLNLYGSTEVSADVTSFEVCDLDSAVDIVPIGRPIANTQVYLLDSSLRPVPVGVPGEVCVGGDGLARGYHNRPELTRERFITHPFCDEPGARLYKTGDVARYRSDGTLEFLRRRDHQVKIRGFRIELGEIESILREHAAVQDAIVIDSDDSFGAKRLVAYIVASDGSPSQTERASAGAEAVPASSNLESDLRGYLKRTVPGYMVPSAFVRMNALPLTPSGKLDRRALPPVAETRVEAGDSTVPPRDAVERKLVRIWERILRVSPVGVLDDFFDLGGDSLLAVRLFVEIERAFQKELPLAVLLEAPTIEGIAAALNRPVQATAWTSLVPIQPGGSLPPFFCVHGGRGHVLTFRLLARHVGTDQPFYGLQPLGLSRNRRPHTRVEEMAAHYLAEIRSLQPLGPYYLGGWCFSGMVVFEMAQQLLAAGERVAMLGIFDGWAPGFPKATEGDSIMSDTAYRFGRRVGLALTNLADADPSDRVPYLWRATTRMTKVAWRRVRERVALSPTMLATQRANREAMQSYQPMEYPGRITLFCASERRGDFCAEPTLGWEGLATAGVEVHKIPGHHLEMYEDPHVRVLARELNACLAKARSSVAD